MRKKQQITYRGRQQLNDRFLIRNHPSQKKMAHFSNVKENTGQLRIRHPAKIFGNKGEIKTNQMKESQENLLQAEVLEKNG